MIEIIVLCVFFGALVIGSIVAESMGRLPSAEAMQDEDRARYVKFQRGR